jgi:hypothetical protein
MKFASFCSVWTNEPQITTVSLHNKFDVSCFNLYTGKFRCVIFAAIFFFRSHQQFVVQARESESQHELQKYSETVEWRGLLRLRSSEPVPLLLKCLHWLAFPSPFAHLSRLHWVTVLCFVESVEHVSSWLPVTSARRSNCVTVRVHNATQVRKSKYVKLGTVS